MVHGKNRIPYWIDRRLTGLAGPEYHAIISFGLPIEPEDSQYGEYRFNALSPHWRGARRRQRWTRNMVHGKNRIPYRIDRRLTGLAGPEYHAIISFGLPIEPEDSQYGEYRIYSLNRLGIASWSLARSLRIRSGASAMNFLPGTTRKGKGFPQPARPSARFLFANNRLSDELRNYRL